MNDYNCKPTCPPIAPPIEVPAIFYKELLPAAKGDDTGPEAPYKGKRRNTLLVYEANNAIYLFSSDGNFTFLGYGFAGMSKEEIERFVYTTVGIEAAIREAADEELAKPMTGATSSTDGKSGMVPAPSAGDEEKALRGDGTWGDISSQTIFYANSQETGNTRHIYKDAAFTQAASAQEILDANEGGPVVLRITTTPNPNGLFSDAYIQNTYVGTGDYQFLFLDERTYREYAASTPSDTTFYYFSNTIQSKLTAGTNIDITNNVISASIPIDTEYNASSGNPVANSTITNSLNRSVVTDVALSANPSTTTVNVDETTTNLTDPAHPTTTVLSLPVASTTQAGVMNKATFDAVTKNTQDIANIKGEVVAITGLPASPTQAELTTAWKSASGETELINGAGIYDTTNEKRWTYYANDDTWHWLDANASIHVQQWTNSAAGIVKGSTVTGQIYAESDGTGSVNGWDTLSGQVSTNTSKLATIASGAEVNVQSDLNITDNTSDAFVKNQFVKRYRTTDSADSYNAGWVYLGALNGNDNGGNKCSIQISGRVGGFVGDSNACTIDLALANRSKACAVGSIVAPDNFGSMFDIVAYQNTDATTGQQTRWYLRQVTSYNSVEVVVRYTTQTADLWNFTKSTTEPSGVKVYSLAEDIANGSKKVSWYNTTTGAIKSTNIDAINTKIEDAAYVDSTIGTLSNLAYVGTTNIQDGAVTTAKIANLNVTDAKLASNSVTTAKIADGAVTSDKIDWTTLNKIHTLSVTAQTGFSVKENGCGYFEIGDKHLVVINLELDVSTGFSGEKTAAVFGNDIPLGSMAPQLAATYQNQATITPCGSWLRIATKGVVVYPPTSVAGGAGASLRITGAYIV